MEIENEVLELLKEDFEWKFQDCLDGTCGSFEKSLAQAFLDADELNLAKLADAFPDMYKKYSGSKGDVLKRFDTIVGYRELLIGHEYELMQPMFYGDAEDYAISNKLSESDIELLSQYINDSGELEFPIGTIIDVIDTKHGSIDIEINGFGFGCIFDDDAKFKQIN